MEAKRALRFLPVSLSGRQCLAVGHGFRQAMERSGLVLHACAILPEHVHVVVARHRYVVERVRQQLKGEAAKALRAEGLHPFARVVQRGGQLHSPWADGGWDVYLDSAAEVRRAVKYVENNPGKEGKAAQRWSFVAYVWSLAALQRNAMKALRCNAAKREMVKGAPRLGWGG